MMNKEENSTTVYLEEKIQAIRRKKSRIKLVSSLLTTAAVVYLLFGVVFGLAIVQGDSMQPSLQSGDIVVFFRLSRSYKTDSIVLVDNKEGSDYIKRVIASSGQTIDIDDENNTVLINGEEKKELYARGKTVKKTGAEYPLTLEKNQYFVLGDHRENSIDSRNYGCVTNKQIGGVVIATFRFGK